MTSGTVLKSAGYNTAYIGKWHLGPGAQSQPHNQGFDSWQLGFKGSTDGVLYAASMKTHAAPEAFVKAATVSLLEAKKPGGPVKAVRVYTHE